MPPQPKKKPENQPPVDDDDDDAGGEAQLSRDDIVKLVNTAVSGQLARKLPAAIEAGLGPMMKKLEELKPAAPKGDEGDEGDGEPGAGAGDQGAGAAGGKGPKKDPQFSAMKRELDAMKRQLAERDEKLQKEEGARKASTIDNELTKVLTDLGVDKHRMRGALAVHRGTAQMDDAGGVFIRLKRDGYDDDLDPATALKEWAETDEGKSYLAPTGATGGAGARPPRSAGPARKPALNSPEAKQTSVREAKESLLSAVGELTAGGSVSVE